MLGLHRTTWPNGYVGAFGLSQSTIRSKRGSICLPNLKRILLLLLHLELETHTFSFLPWILTWNFPSFSLSAWSWTVAHIATHRYNKPLQFSSLHCHGSTEWPINSQIRKNVLYAISNKTKKHQQKLHSVVTELYSYEKDQDSNLRESNYKKAS